MRVSRQRSYRDLLRNKQVGSVEVTKRSACRWFLYGAEMAAERGRGGVVDLRADHDDPRGRRPPGRVLAPPLIASSRRQTRSAHEYTAESATNRRALGSTMLDGCRGVTNLERDRHRLRRRVASFACIYCGHNNAIIDAGDVASRLGFHGIITDHLRRSLLRSFTLTSVTDPAYWHHHADNSVLPATVQPAAKIHPDSI